VAAVPGSAGRIDLLRICKASRREKGIATAREGIHQPIVGVTKRTESVGISDGIGAVNCVTIEHPRVTTALS